MDMPHRHAHINSISSLLSVRAEAKPCWERMLSAPRKPGQGGCEAFHIVTSSRSLNVMQNAPCSQHLFHHEDKCNVKGPMLTTLIFSRSPNAMEITLCLQNPTP
eukprot:1159531-Pelagomonas_calceolata.AAC.8